MNYFLVFLFLFEVVLSTALESGPLNSLADDFDDFFLAPSEGGLREARVAGAIQSESSSAAAAAEDAS